ncbi:hypothetical protein H2198_003054 [Neophaeococcomyces mojaviensis]|uniref:Uncharacterized protein n=1 Tax=Neophaeococcomyces mojaviensis TaxID=3383035 RepID=A0ACC3ACK2_9EURO|nr:hypothetical protein H2198_003054 [Knufia sp. JES_112]
MLCNTYKLNPPTLDAVVEAIKPALTSTYASATIEVTQCPDLRNPPFRLASQGLGGSPIIADIGGQPNLFPRPLLDKKYSMTEIAKDHMQMSPAQGMLIGAGAGPFHIVGQNSELAPNLSWKDGFENVTNLTHYTKIDMPSSSTSSKVVVCEKCPSTDCALMMNLFGSSGQSGPVLKITARKRTGSTKSFTDVIRFALHDRFGDEQPVSLGGVFVIKRGKAKFHVMPDFPPADQMPFKSRDQVNDWLTFHDFSVKGAGTGDEIVCLSVLHSADPGDKMGLRIEHTHCFGAGGRGGHYHYDLEDEEVEYEGYFNVAETIYRVDRP